MNIHEYQAKEILQKFGVPTGQGVAILSEDEIDSAIDSLKTSLYVVKAQIYAGGRGKAGGVKIAKTAEEAKKHARSMWGMNLITHQTGPEGQKVQRLYVESGCDIKKEYYFSVVLDRSNSCITLMASSEGGVDIEEVAKTNPEKIIKVTIDPAVGMQPFHARQVAFGLNFKGDQIKKVCSFVDGCYKAFVSTDANQIEINPLVETADGEIKALDAKFNFDENALFRHPDIANLRDEAEENPLELRASKANLSYVKMDGNIGCMVNGAGLAMSTMDIIKYYGAEPANFLDVGGGANKEKVTEAFKIIMSDPKVEAILVNIFGGIMRCDIIAEGIIAAAKEVSLSVPLVVRLAGTNFELGKKMLSESGLSILAADDLGDAAQKVVSTIKKGA